MVSVSYFGVRVSVMFHFMFIHYTFSSVWVVVWPPFWEIAAHSVSKSNRKAMNRNWSNQKANPAFKTKTGNK